MEVASVNLTQTNELRFPDIPDGDFDNNSRHNLSSVMLPRAAFLSNASGRSKNGNAVGMISFFFSWKEGFGLK